MAREDELRDVLDQAAKHISHTQPNPRSWQSWMIYLLGQLEDAATKESQAYQGAFTEMLEALQDGIRTRLRTGGW